ncbi:hypothetical protein NU219Hw_g8861t1 [Hortaea werneckii]
MDDSEVLRRVAARRSAIGFASGQSQSSRKGPRSQPAQAVTSTPLPRAAEIKVTSLAGTTASSFNDDDATSATPVTERSTNTMVANDGSAPSLKGDLKALEEARDFFQTISKAKTHSRAPRSTSSPHSSREPRAQNMLSDSKQGATPFYSPVSRAAKAETASSFSENTRPEVSKWADFSATHYKPASLRGTSHQSFTSNASYASSSSLSTPITAAAGAFKTEADSVDDITSALQGTSITEDSPGATLAPKSQSKGTGLFDRQIAGVNNTFKELKSEMPPPHMRGKAFDQGQSLQSKASTPVGKPTESADTAGLLQPMLPATAPAGSSKAVTKTEAADAGTSVESKASHKQSDVSPPQDTKKACDSPGKNANTIIPDTDIFDIPKATQSETVGVDGDISGTLAKLQKNIKELGEKFKNLEVANVEMEHQLEQLVKKDERRRFMGTGDMNTPFAIEVAYPDGTRRAIQVSVGLKVADLIRRCRVDAKIEAGATSNPRIAVDGSFVGHGQLLGEVNVTNGTNKFVAFQYDLV